MLTFFAQHGESTKRFNVSKPESMEELRDLIRTKYSSLPQTFQMQCKDTEFDVICDFEDLSQLENGLKLTIIASEEANEPVDAEFVGDLQSKIQELEQHNAQLRIQNEGQTSSIVIPDGHHIRLIGVPFDVSKDDIKRFLKEVKIVDDGIYILRQLMSHAAKGEALVTVETPEDVDQAKLLHKEKIGQRWIEIREATEEDFTRYQVINEAGRYLKSGNMQSFHDGYIAKLKGMEYGHKMNDIEAFLDPIVPLRIWICYNRRAQNSGVAYVEVATMKELQDVVAKKKQYIGERWIDIWQADETEMKFDLAQMVGAELKPDQLVPGSKTLRMEGVPRQASDQMLANFFRVIGVMPIRIHRKNTGDSAYVEFVTEQDCKIALTRNNAYIENRYISLRQVMSSEVSRAVPQAVAPLSYMDREDIIGRRRESPRGRDMFDEPRRAYGRHDSPPASRRNRSYDPYSRDRTRESQTIHNQLLNIRARTSMRERDGFRKKYRDGTPNPMVKMVGLPFQCTSTAVEDFFDGFKFDPESIRFLEKNGRATGTGRIEFDSTEEAERAIEAKNNKYIGNRYIKLSWWSV